MLNPHKWRTFRELRHYIKQNQQFVTQSEQDIENIQKSIDTLNENFISEKDVKNFVIYKGQKFEADAAYLDIYRQATTSIYVVEDFQNQYPQLRIKPNSDC